MHLAGGNNPAKEAASLFKCYAGSR